MSLFPADDKARKMLPIFKMVTGYFPKALREITRVCVANNIRYNPEKSPSDINWARGKSTDQLGSAFRHMLESEVDGLIFETVSAEVTEATSTERVYVLAEAAWRLLAALELKIEQVEAGSVGVIESAGQPKEAYNGQTDSKNPRRDPYGEVRIDGPPVPHRGQEPCSQRIEPGLGKWNPGREG